MVSKGFRELAQVFQQLNQKGQGRLRLFLVAFFFYSMGYMTVIYLATIFGTKELGMEANELIITVMIITPIRDIMINKSPRGFWGGGGGFSGMGNPCWAGRRQWPQIGNARRHRSGRKSY